MDPVAKYGKSDAASVVALLASAETRLAHHDVMAQSKSSSLDWTCPAQTYTLNSLGSALILVHDITIATIFKPFRSYH